MTDCNITANYFAEKERLCASILECFDCPLRDCTSIEKKYPKRAISIVQRWSNEHPNEHSKRTFLTELLKNYPNLPLCEDGTPVHLCPSNLGLNKIEECNYKCARCWNQTVEDGKK